MLWNPANIVDIMEDDLDVTEAVLLDDTMALLYVGQRSAGEGLTEEDNQACIDHFSPYMEWRYGNQTWLPGPHPDWGLRFDKGLWSPEPQDLEGLR